MASNIGTVVLTGPLPIGEDVVSRVPDLVLLCLVDPSEPPVYHWPGAIFHIS